MIVYKHYMETGEEKVAVVTGGISGIGLTAARLFKKEGVKVIVNYNDIITYQNILSVFFQLCLERLCKRLILTQNLTLELHHKV